MRSSGARTHADSDYDRRPWSDRRRRHEESCRASSAAPTGCRRGHTGANFNSAIQITRCGDAGEQCAAGACIPTGSEVLENKNGTAPGLWIAAEKNHVILLPGPPSELKPMFEISCVPRLQKTGRRRLSLARRVFRTAGLPESSARCSNRADLHEVQEPQKRRFSRNLARSKSALRHAARLKKKRNDCCTELGDQIDQALDEYIFATVRTVARRNRGSVSGHEERDDLRSRNPVPVEWLLSA